jgi:hypothetical protein
MFYSFKRIPEAQLHIILYEWLIAEFYVPEFSYNVYVHEKSYQVTNYPKPKSWLGIC